MSYFKKGISFLSVLVLLCAITFTFSGGLKANEPDEQGIDPWLGIFHDSQNTGFSDSIAQPPFEEAWTFEGETGQYTRLGEGCAVYNNVVYVANMPNTRGGSSEVIAIDINSGDELWRTEIDGRLSFGKPTIAPDLGLLYVVSTNGYGPKGSGESFVSAISLDGGDVEWSEKVQGAVFGSPLYAGDGVYVQTNYGKKVEGKDYDTESEPGEVIKLNAEDGSIQWSQEVKGSMFLIDLVFFDTPLAYKDDVVFAASSNIGFNSSKGLIYFLPSAVLYAFDSDSGDVLWEVDLGSEYVLSGGVSCDDQYVYVCWHHILSNARNLEVSAFEIETGDLAWTYEMSGGISFCSTPLIGKEHIFINDREGNIIAINKESGKKAWSKKVGDITEATMLASNAGFAFGVATMISNNRLSGSKVQAFDLEAKGKSVWKDEIDGAYLTHVAIYGKYLILTGWQGVYCYESEMPELTVSPEKLEIGEIERGIKKDIPVSIQNKGKEGLEGTVSADAPWIKVSPEKINDKTNELIVTIDTHGLELKEYSGNINIVSNGGNKKIQVTITVVDKTPPTVEFDFSDLIKIGDNLYTNNKNYSLKGKTEPTAVLEIQDKEVSVDENGNFETELELKEGENIIKVKATDDVGNSGSQELKIFLDTTPPNVMLATENYTLSKEPNIYIMGQVDDKDATVTINGDKVDLAANGSFAVLVFLKKGENLFEIKATDKIGNEKVIKLVVVYPENALIVLYVGKKTGEVNAKTVNLDVAPFIHKKTGRTMVPLRFIGEALGAKVDWDNAERKVTYTLYGRKIELWIDKATALVNGNPVVVDPPPYIVSGRTVVPLRFVSENLGASVEWDSKSQRITIRFPAP
jgi:outer membrane protein assembly factor BamB